MPDDDNYEMNENVAPWQRSTTARVEQKEVTKEVVHCEGCGETWEPMDGPPKHCKECKAKLEYGDDLEQESEDSEEDDLDSLFEGDGE